MKRAGVLMTSWAELRTNRSGLDLFVRATCRASGHQSRTGLSRSRRVLRNVAKDDSISYTDVALPEGRLCDRLRTGQAARFNSRSTVTPNDLRRGRQCRQNVQQALPAEGLVEGCK